ncbi:MAG: arsenosugar biosynthesis radical SAM protein ArsS [Candidatus Eisenbacteria bacterium]|nr:arsenosugar biosynthesis radical SAM protein ArsS [Candidatus Eisenbacteria bacterium]
MAEPTLNKLRVPLADPKVQLRQLHALAIERSFEAQVAGAGHPELRADGIQVLQINVGKRCNQVCHHCHVDAGPDRREVMSAETVDHCLRVLAQTDIPTLDITGGAPELHPEFRRMVREARALGRQVMDRCNLTILLLPNYSDLPEFLAENQVEVIASLPYYLPKQTDAQRGEGVFDGSIEALRRLNDLGYGVPGSGLKLDLVTNPVGAFLPAKQSQLEAEWRRELARRHGVTFNSLYTITNMPISRFLEFLLRSGNLETYMQKLVQAFNPAAVNGLMCRTTLSVGWDGTLYDCDFNQMLELTVDHGGPRHIRDFQIAPLARRQIVTAPHCFGCTAGAGSSCGGALAD